MPPVNEMMAPLAFTVSEMIFTRIPRHNSVTVMFSLVELQHAFKEQSSPLIKNGKTKRNKRGKSSVTSTCMHDPLPLLVKVFFLSLRNSALVFFLGPGFNFFAVQGFFSSFLSRFHDLIRNDR